MNGGTGSTGVPAAPPASSAGPPRLGDPGAPAPRPSVGVTTEGSPPATPRAGPPGRHLCRHCGEAHARRHYLELHMGQAHRDVLDPTERDAVEQARAYEAAWFRRFRKHVRSGLAVVPVFLLFVLTGVLLSEVEGNAGFAIMLLPAFFAFSALVYAMTFSHLTLKET